MLKFLKCAKELGFDVGRVNKKIDHWQVFVHTLKVVADWHRGLMSKGNTDRNTVARKRDRIEREADQMAQLVYALSTGSLQSVRRRNLARRVGV